MMMTIVMMMMMILTMTDADVYVSDANDGHVLTMAMMLICSFAQMKKPHSSVNGLGIFTW